VNLKTETPVLREPEEGNAVLRIQDPPKKEKADAVGEELDELAREGARRMLMQALDAEVADYIERHQDARDDEGHALVVRNGRARKRRVTLGCGTVEVEAPRVNDQRVVNGERARFTSELLPPYMRRSPKVDEVLPVLYLRGLSTGDFEPALKSLLGDKASGLSATTISRMTAEWKSEYEAFRAREVRDEFVYVWVDGVHFNIRLEDDRLCTLVVIGVRKDGTKCVLAVEDGYRESNESWLFVLRGLTKRGMKAPMLAIGDGALGFWAAARELWPETTQQLCWVHKLKNVLDKLPRRLQGRAKVALHEIMNAETREQAEEACETFREGYEAKYPKAVASLIENQKRLLAFFDFPAEHWEHIRSANPIESAFATLRLRQRVTKGAGSRAKALWMAYKLLDMASLRWRRVNAPELVARVLLREKFVDGLPETKDVGNAA
jgi:putative transposase